MNHWAVIPAAGVGRRFGAAHPKQYLLLGGKPLLSHVLDCFLAHPRITGIVLAVAEADPYIEALLPTEPGKPVLLASGGESRAASVRNALQVLHSRVRPDDWILVHDAARPCLTVAELDRLIVTLDPDPVGGLLATPVSDTVKRVDTNNRVIRSEDRTELWRALTPQMFRYGILSSALHKALDTRPPTPVTDEAMAVELAGHCPTVVKGRAENIKVTHPEDLEYALWILSRRQVTSE